MKSWKILASVLLLSVLTACNTSKVPQQALPKHVQSPLSAQIKPRPLVHVNDIVDERSLIEAFSQEQGRMLNVAMGASYGVRHTVLAPFTTQVLKEGATDFANLRANSNYAQAALFIPEPTEFKGSRAQISAEALESLLVQHEKLLLIFEQAQRLSLNAGLATVLRDMQARYQRNAEKLLYWSDFGMPAYSAPKAKKSANKSSKSKSAKSKSSKSKNKSKKKKH